LTALPNPDGSVSFDEADDFIDSDKACSRQLRRRYDAPR
jgi:hypothetical protein